jgi:hypothetical protein
MTKNEFAAKLNENVDIQALMAQIANAETDEAVLEILKNYGLEMTPEEIRGLNDQEGELGEAALEDVAGGCECKGILKRAVTNFLFWIVEKATGKRPTCLDCGH